MATLFPAKRGNFAGIPRRTRGNKVRAVSVAGCHQTIEWLTQHYRVTGGLWTRASSILSWSKRSARRLSNGTKTRDERLNRDKVRQARLRLATHAEKTTQKNIIRATKNSGRTDKDGDHVAGGYVTLDTKLQSKRLNPVVIATELAKVRNDSASAKTMVGGLVLRSKTGLGVVVFHEDDFAKILNLIEGK
jgi:hypothetical protein